MMKTKQSKRFIQMCSMLSGVVMFLFAGQAHALLVDPFDTDQGPVIVETTNTTHDDTVTGGDILGGEREMLVHCGVGCSELKRIFALVDGGLLSHSQDDGVTGYTILRWDGITLGDDALSVDPTGLDDVDFTEGDSQIGLFYNISYDVDVDLTFTAYTDAGNFSSLAMTHIDETPGHLNGLEFTALYSDFSVEGGTGADFHHISALQLKIEASSPNLDMNFDFIRTTDGEECGEDCIPHEMPEPGTWVLFGTGLIGIVGYGWRRNKGIA